MGDEGVLANGFREALHKVGVPGAEGGDWENTEHELIIVSSAQIIEHNNQYYGS